jgi:hypothetical protein
LFKWLKRKKSFSLIAENNKETIYLIVDEEMKRVYTISQRAEGVHGREYRLVEIEKNK